MISVDEDDRGDLRFLWLDDPFSENPEVVVLRFTRVAFGLSRSSFLLNATLKHHILKYENGDPEFVQKLPQSLCVDDILTGGSDDDEAFDLYIKGKSRLAGFGFNARKFVSNSKNLMHRLKENERLLELASQGTKVITRSENIKTVSEEDESFPKSVVHSPDTSPATEKVLGVSWNKEDDQLILDVRNIVDRSVMEEPNPTKHDVARITSKIYDPLGFITPMTVKVKMFCQSLCEKKMEWDEVLDESSKGVWNSLLKDLKKSEPVIVPRCFFSDFQGDVASVSLEGFCDASV